MTPALETDRLNGGRLAQLRTRLAAHLRHPLYRNGYALLLSGGATSVLGLAYWTLAARLYPAQVVGLNSALLSAMVLLSGIAQLSLSNVLVRFLPVAGPRTTRLVGYAYLASLAAAVAVAIIFMAGLAWWAPALLFVKASAGWRWSVGLAIATWGIFTLQDSVLTGLRQAVWVPVENVIFAVVKLAFLVAFARWVPESGIFLSWTLPVAISLLPINLLIFGRLIPRRAAPAAAAPAALTLRPVVRYAAGNNLGLILQTAYTYTLPIIVANQAGAAAAAYFYLPWTVAAGLQLIAANLATSLTVEATLFQDQLRAYGQRILQQVLRLLLPLVILIVIAAPWLLRVFGADYATEGTLLLRCVSLAAIPNVVVVLAGGIVRVQNRPGVIAVIHGVLGALVLGLTYALLPRLGITGVGVAWLVSQTIVALGLVVTVLIPLFRIPPREQPDRTGSAA